MEKLLIVDDEEIELDGMAELIDWQSAGYELVGTAINGKRGLALLEEKHPDIVITDIKMPVMDGLAMIRAAQEQNADTVFVVLSGYGDYEYTSQAMQLGIRHYILKPCDESKILPVLEQARAELHERRSNAKKPPKWKTPCSVWHPWRAKKPCATCCWAVKAGPGCPQAWRRCWAVPTGGCCCCCCTRARALTT